jgi:predicted Zn-ribbon and HTH transcriptional regulator
MKWVKLSMWGLRCLRCGHEWVPRGVEQPENGKAPPEPKDPPRICPKCKSAYFDVPPKTDADEAPASAGKKPRRAQKGRSG